MLVFSVNLFEENQLKNQYKICLRRFPKKKYETEATKQKLELKLLSKPLFSSVTGGKKPSFLV